MNDALHAAASGLTAVERMLEVATQNAVNGQTPGYLARVIGTRSFETDLDVALDRDGALVSTWDGTNFSQGTLVAVDDDLAVAVRGPGFMVVESDHGVHYTRKGDLTVGPDGTLQTQSGYAVLGINGRIRGDIQGPAIRAAAEGRVFQGDTELGRIRLVSFDRPDLLTRSGETLFDAPPEAGERTTDAGTVMPRMLELPRERGLAGLVSLISANRDYEAAQRVISMINQSYERLARG
jgi:flagellar basal body rod protein FlgG